MLCDRVLRVSCHLFPYCCIRYLVEYELPSQSQIEEFPVEITQPATEPVTVPGGLEGPSEFTDVQHSTLLCPYLPQCVHVPGKPCLCRFLFVIVLCFASLCLYCHEFAADFREGYSRAQCSHRSISCTRPCSWLSRSAHVSGCRRRKRCRTASQQLVSHHSFTKCCECDQNRHFQAQLCLDLPRSMSQQLSHTQLIVNMIPSSLFIHVFPSFKHLQLMQVAATHLFTRQKLQQHKCTIPVHKLHLVKRPTPSPKVIGALFRSMESPSTSALDKRKKKRRRSVNRADARTRPGTLGDVAGAVVHQTHVSSRHDALSSRVLLLSTKEHTKVLGSASR